MVEVVGGRFLDIPVFFTIVSKKFSSLNTYQKYRKIHAGAFAKVSVGHIKDSANLIISTQGWRHGMERLQKATFLYASPYMRNHDINAYIAIRKQLGRPLGLSHHGEGIDGLLHMMEHFDDVPVIEKHFFLGDKIVYQGKTYRDCLHSVGPNTFKQLALAYKG